MVQLWQGAEAIISENKNKIIKERIVKKYRHPKLDEQIRKKRIKAEIKILKKIKGIVLAPQVEENQEGNKIIMQKIIADKLSQKLNIYPEKIQKHIMLELGKIIWKLHNENIMHGDLTTSNILYDKKNDKIYLIDFGLSLLNAKHEDKGVDIHLLKQALESKHFKNCEKLFKEFEKGYFKDNFEEAKKVFDRLIQIEKRGRYKH